MANQKHVGLFLVASIIAGCADDTPTLGATAQAIESRPSVWPDKADYAPLETALLSGSGWASGEDVWLEIACNCSCSIDEIMVTSDAGGSFVDAPYAITEAHLGATCNVTAVGQSSGLMAHTSFTDGNIRVFAAPTGTSFALAYSLHTGTNCTGAIVVRGGQPVQGSETVFAGTPSNHAASATESVKLTVASTSLQGGAFVNWTSAAPSSPATPTIANTLCVAGFSGGGNRQYTASYSPANRNPVVTCQDVAGTTTPTTCSLQASVIVATSDLDGDTVTCTETPAASHALGSTVVTASCNDGRGGTASCSATVTLSDDDAPAASCPAPATTECTSPAGAMFVFAMAATDNCDGSPSIGCAVASGSTFPLGTTTNGCTASDDAGNTSSCSFTVAVTDTTPPAIACPAAQTVECTGDHAAIVDPGDAAGSDVCGDVSITGYGPGRYALGTTTVGYQATDAAGLASSCTTSVTVADTLPPSVACPAAITAECTGNRAATVDVAAATASDQCGGTTMTDPAAGAYPVGLTSVIQTASDDAGHASSCTTPVTVVDTLAPSIVCPPPVIAECTSNGAAIVDVVGASASDQCGAVSVTDPSATSYPLGTTTLLQSATDEAGLSDSCSTSVTVADTTAPTFTSIPAPQTIVGDCSGASRDFIRPISRDACGTSTVTCEALAGTSYGVNNVTCTARDALGNTTTTTIIVAVLQPLRIAFLAPLADDSVADNIATDADVTNIFQVKSTVPHHIKLYSCSGADVTSSVHVTATLSVTLKYGPATQSDANVVPMSTGVGDSNGVMVLVGGTYKYNLTTTGYHTNTASSSLYFNSVVRVSYTSFPGVTVGEEDVWLDSK